MAYGSARLGLAPGFDGGGNVLQCRRWRVFGETEPMRDGPLGRLSVRRVFLQPDRPLPVRDRLRLTGTASIQEIGWPAG
jgi:hypothetical protein